MDVLHRREDEKRVITSVKKVCSNRFWCAVSSVCHQCILAKTTTDNGIYVSYEDYRENNNSFAFGQKKVLTIKDIASKSANAVIEANINSSWRNAPFNSRPQKFPLMRFMEHTLMITKL